MSGDEWGLTAQPVDRFGHDGDMGFRFVVAEALDCENNLAAYDEADECIRIFSAERLRAFRFDYVGNMRRAVARVLRGGLEVDDGAMRFGGRFAGPGRATPEQAAEALIPDDWRPGGAS